MTLAQSYSTLRGKYENSLEENRFSPIPNRYQLAAAIDSLRLDFLILVNKEPWHPITSDTFMHFTIPEEREGFMMWDGADDELFCCLASRLLIQMRLAMERKPSQSLLCDHKGCLLSRNIEKFKFFLHSTHIGMMDRDSDGKITIGDVDVNGDGILRLGFGFSNEIFPASTKAIQHLEKVLSKIFPDINGNQIEILSLNFSQISEAAGRSWHWYD